MKKNALLILLLSASLTGCSFNFDFFKSKNNENNQNSQENHENSGENEGNDPFPEVVLVELKITKNPTKTVYEVGDIFDPTGMEVTGVYNNTSEKLISDYSYSKTPLQFGDKSVEISVGNIKTSVSITVKTKEEVDEYTTTVNFHGPTFATYFPEGTNFDQQQKFDELCEYIDAQLDYYDLINKITLVKGQSRKVNSDTYLQIGTGSGDGSLTWNCKEKIYAIEIKAMAYSKYNDYGGVWNVDRNAHLKINNVDFSLEVPSGNPEIITLPVQNYDEGITSFTIASSGGRVLVSEITITWRG